MVQQTGNIKSKFGWNSSKCFFFRFRIMKTEISIRSDRCFALYPLYYLAFSHWSHSLSVVSFANYTQAPRRRPDQNVITSIFFLFINSFVFFHSLRVNDMNTQRAYLTKWRWSLDLIWQQSCYIAETIIIKRYIYIYKYIICKYD